MINQPRVVPSGSPSRRLLGVRLAFSAAVVRCGRAVWFAVLLLGSVAPTVSAQAAAPLPPCTNWLCEEFKIYVTALDTVQAMQLSRCAQSPISLAREIRAFPVMRIDGSVSPQIARMDDFPLSWFTSARPHLRIREMLAPGDSANRDSSSTLCALEVSRVTWVGESKARLHAFLHFGPMGNGREFFIWLSRDRDLWRVDKVMDGRQQGSRK